MYSPPTEQLRVSTAASDSICVAQCECECEFECECECECEYVVTAPVLDTPSAVYGEESRCPLLDPRTCTWSGREHLLSSQVMSPARTTRMHAA